MVEVADRDGAEGVSWLIDWYLSSELNRYLMHVGRFDYRLDFLLSIWRQCICV